MRKSRFSRLLNQLLLGCLIAGSLSACSTLDRKNAVPQDLTTQSYIEGMPDVRYKIWSRSGIQAMVDDMRLGQQKPEAYLDPNNASYLALSGGGDNGAFGAGLLTGWTERGDRPVFSLVTGVSTGAMIAPFAYLGSDYDYVLKKTFTDVDQKDIFIELGLTGALFGDAFADTSPLYQLISEFITPELLQKIAFEYTVRNRWLVVATTNLDAGVPVLWNMGKLAAVGTPESLHLFRKILLASAAIPGAFPPVMIDVMAEGKHYQEMHVDGGASTELFLYPTALSQMALKEGVVSRYKNRQAYIIRNARLDSEWRQIERNTLSIMGRAVDQLIQTQGGGDIYRTYLVTQRDGVHFNLAYIGPDFKVPHKKEFDRQYMNALFDYARNLSRAGYPWAHSPPGYDLPVNEAVKLQVQRQKQVLKRYRMEHKQTQ
ncbi:MAG: patatin-like phospholipase family protein [Fluviibacter sp.]